MNQTECIQYPAPKREYKVLVRCFTYNQSEYIEDALNGFAMQQTDFPFVCLVMDDASTDGEQDVIKRWMERECDMSKAEIIDIQTSVVTIAPHRINTFCTFAFYLLKQNLFGTGDKKMNHVYPWREKCEYEALCEGDDYWIDPLKLQKQAKILDEHIEFSFCYTKANILVQETNTIVRVGGTPYIDYEHMILNNPVMTLTVLLRIELQKKYFTDINPYQYNWKLGDFPMWLYFAANGTPYFLDDVTSTYRVLRESESHSCNIQKMHEFSTSIFQVQKLFNALYNKNSRNILNSITKEYYTRNICTAISLNNYEYYTDNISQLGNSHIFKKNRWYFGVMRLKHILKSSWFYDVIIGKLKNRVFN